MSIKDKYVYLTADKEDQTCIGIKGGKFAGVDTNMVKFLSVKKLILVTCLSSLSLIS